MQQFLDRRSQGIPLGEAWEITRLEHALKSWPLQWGDYLHVSLYGAINLSTDIDVPNLGIHVSSSMEKGHFIFGSSFCYDCQIRVKNRNIDGFWDAIGRLEIFINAVNVATSFAGATPTQGVGASIQYYCQFLYNFATVGLAVNEHTEIVKEILGKLEKCSHEHRQILIRSMWWMRQARHDILTGNAAASVFSLYLSYWNAFECLVDFVCQIKPLSKFSKSEKRRMVTEYFEGRVGAPCIDDIEKCYHEIVNPGLKIRATHALITAFGEHVGKEFCVECFTKAPVEERLYQIRNDIDHGNIVEYSFSTRLRVINGLNRLQPIVLLLFRYSIANI